MQAPADVFANAEKRDGLVNFFLVVGQIRSARTSGAQEANDRENGLYVPSSKDAEAQL
jgi:hypothetical protein